jgi:hypothetical protein
MGRMLPLWDCRRRPDEGVSTAFAPFVLVQAFVTWMALLVLMTHALADAFQPALPSFSQTLVAAGSALPTVASAKRTPRASPAGDHDRGAGNTGSRRLHR